MKYYYTIPLMEGIFAVNKPVGITSHDVIYKLRRQTGVKRIGHAGTLDPLASGVLVVAIGREFTKQLEKHVKSEKEYIAEIFLGQTSTTDDMEGEKIIVNNKIKPNFDEVEKTLKQFVGKIMQTPPSYSAIKVGGKVAYKQARIGKALKLEPREVKIKNIELLDYKYPVIKLKITCGKGVYIRSLARDIGEKLKTGAYMKSLVRTRVGDFKIENAKNLED
jgi:tRNA pseudouridine55 synthase